jgi:hypothetical protein
LPLAGQQQRLPETLRGRNEVPMFAIEKVVNGAVAEQHPFEVNDVDLIGIRRPDLPGACRNRLPGRRAKRFIDPNVERFGRCRDPLDMLTQGVVASALHDGGCPEQPAAGGMELLKLLSRHVDQQRQDWAADFMSIFDLAFKLCSSQR